MATGITDSRWLNDEYTDEWLNNQYYEKPIRFGTKSEGCKGYTHPSYARLTRSKYRDANWME